MDVGGLDIGSFGQPTTSILVFSMHELIEDHYRENYDRLVKRTTNRVPYRSEALAEECVQEAYSRALRYARTFDPNREGLDNWLHTILRNVVNACRNDEADRGVSKELEDDDGVELVPSRREKWSALFVLEKMKQDNHHRILTLFLLYGYGTKEIAEFVGLRHDNVRQIISRWRANMYASLTKDPS